MSWVVPAMDMAMPAPHATAAERSAVARTPARTMPQKVVHDSSTPIRLAGRMPSLENSSIQETKNPQVPMPRPSRVRRSLPSRLTVRPGVHVSPIR
jgi:hypothetical protein